MRKVEWVILYCESDKSFYSVVFEHRFNTGSNVSDRFYRLNSLLGYNGCADRYFRDFESLKEWCENHSSYSVFYDRKLFEKGW